jgi:hypothetical protein
LARYDLDHVCGLAFNSNTFPCQHWLTGLAMFLWLCWLMAYSHREKGLRVTKFCAGPSIRKCLYPHAFITSERFEDARIKKRALRDAPLKGETLILTGFPGFVEAFSRLCTLLKCGVNPFRIKI